MTVKSGGIVRGKIGPRKPNFGGGLKGRAVPAKLRDDNNQRLRSEPQTAPLAISASTSPPE
jgi:hypothetical protein